MYYVASPYTDPSFNVRQARYIRVAEYVVVASKFFGDFVYSPIMYWHYPAYFLNMPQDSDAWELQNLRELQYAKCLLVLEIPGWEESKGVQREIVHARNRNIPVQLSGNEGAIVWTRPCSL